jgi:hypothetical protein
MTCTRCHGSGELSQGFQRETPYSDLSQSIWDLWLIKRDSTIGFSLSTSVLRSLCHPTNASHTFTYHTCYIILAIDGVFKQRFVICHGYTVGFLWRRNYKCHFSRLCLRSHHSDRDDQTQRTPNIRRVYLDCNTVRRVYLDCNTVRRVYLDCNTVRRVYLDCNTVRRV